MADSKGKTKSSQTMDRQFQGWGVQRRMDRAVQYVVEDKMSQAEAARRCGVSRPRLNLRVKEYREKLDEQQARSEMARKERAGLDGASAALSEFIAETTTVPQFQVTKEVRRVPDFATFDRMYFGNLECPDCGVHHDTPGFHLEMMDKLTDAQVRRLLINVPPYHAKVLALDTPIPTPTGWTTIDDLRPGDDVFDRDGKVCQVVALSELKACRRRVVLGDGSEFVTDDEHRWWVEPRDSGARFVTTGDLMASPEPRRFRVPLTAPLDLPDADLPIDPYVLGYWLGDGATAGAVFTAHQDDQPSLIAHLEAAGYRPWATGGYRVQCPGGLMTQLRALGVLGNKHVPARYLRSSSAQRLALLQGLMDSDGTVNVAAGNASFTSTKSELAAAVFELVASLGWKPRTNKSTAELNGVEFGPAYNVSFCPSRSESPFRLERKTNLLPETRTRQKTRPVKRVETLETPVLGRCVAVSSPTQTFLAGPAMVPTGNSTVATVKRTVYELCRDPNSRTMIVSKGTKLAERFLYSIVKQLTDPDVYIGAEANLIEDWGPFQSPGSQWNKNQIYIAGRQSAEKDPSVMCYGVGATIYGVRADTIIFDDVADLENQRNPERVAEMLKWATQEAASRVGRNGKLIFVGTRVSAGDIYSHLQNLPGFDVIRYSCILDEDGEQTLWPEHFPFDAATVMRDSMSAEQWQLVYQNVDTPGFGSSFPPEVVETCHDVERTWGHYDSRWALVAGLDPAGSGKQAGHTAFVLLGVDLQTGKRYLVDIVDVKQMKAPQMKDQIFDWADRYSPALREFRVEVNGLQAQLTQYNNEIMSHLTNRGVRFAPHITSGHNKWDPQFGVESMAPMFYNRQISIPWGDVNSRNKFRTFEEQLTQFPMGTVTDQVMAFWFAELGARELYQRSAVPAFDPRMKVPGYVRRRRHVVDFGEGRVLSPTPQEQAGHPLFPAPDAAPQRQLVNVAGTVTTW